MKQEGGIQIAPASFTQATLGSYAAAAITMVSTRAPSIRTTAMVTATTTRGVGFLWRDRAKQFALSESVI